MNWKFWKKETKKHKRQVRRFEAAKTERLFSGFATEPRTLDQDLKDDLPQLTARARWLAQNDDYVRRYLKVVKNNVIGPRGIELRANYMERGTPFKAGIDAVESAWKQWGESPEVSGRLCFHECEQLFVEHIARDGEAVVMLQPRGDFGLQLQFVDPMSIAHRLCEKINSEREIIMGVEIDTNFGTPTAYYLYTNDTRQPDVWTFNRKSYRRVPAEMIIHAYRMEQVNQTRGFTPLASTIRRLKMLNGYEEAALVAARAGASRMGFYQNTGDQQYEGDDEDSTGELLSDFEAGTMTELPRGYDVKEFNTNWPNVDHSDYVKSVLRGIASGIGISYNTLANDLEGVNFSSIRAGVLEDREEWKGAQSWVAKSLHQRVFKIWLGNALALGRIRNKNQPYTLDRYDQFSQVSWQGRRWDWVDPLKDINANTTAIDYKIRSISDVIREQGRDPDEVFAEIARDNERLIELGIKVETNEQTDNLSLADAESASD